MFDAHPELNVYNIKPVDGKGGLVWSVTQLKIQDLGYIPKVSSFDLQLKLKNTPSYPYTTHSKGQPLKQLLSIITSGENRTDCGLRTLSQTVFCFVGTGDSEIG